MHTLKVICMPNFSSLGWFLSSSTVINGNSNDESVAINNGNIHSDVDKVLKDDEGNLRKHSKSVETKSRRDVRNIEDKP